MAAHCVASIILFCIVFTTTKGQEVTVKSDVTAAPDIEGDYFALGMCTPMGQSRGAMDDYCKCGRDVVDCDFSKFKSKNLTTIELKAFFREDVINRICICNTPKNLQVVLAEYFIKSYFNVARVDIFNLKGPLIIDGAFSTFFAGDMFMSKVNFLRAMFPWEYGRGRDRDRFKGDPTVLKCCSEIKTPKFTSPTFYMEESTVDFVHAAGLKNEHLWNNMLFNEVTFNAMESYSIEINGQEENASFTNCHFHYTNRTAIVANDFLNLVLAHNTFHETCHRMPIGARSYGSTSVLALIQNKFDIPLVLEVDAQQIAIWFNAFTMWNADTFRDINETVHGDRKVSVEFNTVGRYDVQEYDIRPFQAYDSRIIFNENLILPCDCSTLSRTKFPKVFQNFTQRCFSESGGRKEPCHLKISDVKDDCSKTLGKPNYAILCGTNENNFRSFAYSKTFKEVEPFLKMVSFPIKSPFINDMLQHVKSPFQSARMKADKKTLNNSKRCAAEVGLEISLLLGLALVVLK